MTLVPALRSVEPGCDVIRRADPDDLRSQPGELRRKRAAAPDVGADGPHEERIPAHEDVPPGLPVAAAPEVGAVADPRRGAAAQAAQAGGEGQIEPDDGVGALEDEAAERALV